MKLRAREHTEAITESIVRHLHERLSPDEAGPIEHFVRRYYEDVFAEDLEGSKIDDLYGASLSLWRFIARRKPGGPKVRVYNPRFEEDGWQSTHTVVDILNDDMPFLVDSITAALNRIDLTVHFLIHPIVTVRRDQSGKLVELLAEDDAGADASGESVVHVEVTQQSSGESLERIRETLERVLVDVRNATGDWSAMLDKVNGIIDALKSAPPALPEEDVAEGVAFLEWARDNHFTFLGYREYRIETAKDATYLRLGEGSGLGVLREVLPGSIERSNTPLSPLVETFARQKELLIITKANSRSTVHRPVYMDYIGVRRFDAKGEVIGEQRFLGLFTSAAYNRNPRVIPLLRQKVDKILTRSRFAPNSHNGKALLNILDTYPRDELFQTPEDALFDIAHGILHLEERQRIRLFIRRDSYARFFSCIVYVARERYNTALRIRMQEILVESLGGRSAEFTVQLSEAMMARIHFIVHTPGGDVPEFDPAEIEARIVAATRLWTDDLRDACIDRWGEAKGIALYHRYEDAFPAGYHDSFSAQAAVFDVDKIEGLDGDDVAMSLYNRIDAPLGTVHFKIYHPESPVPLSDILPVLEHMGLKVIEEAPYRIAPVDSGPGFWIHDFAMQSRRGEEIEVARVREMFQNAFAKVWHGEAEDDGFNALVLGAGLAWREVSVLRACCKYLRQTGIAFSQDYMEETLGNNPDIARLIVELFVTRFDPESSAGRETRSGEVETRIFEALDAVANLDEDRILRSFHNLVASTLRTNYFQPGEVDGFKPYLSLKIESAALDELPLPRPWVEIFVCSPRFEAVHLRGGRVARGGIRWSDRREDFRTEILGLMKAQMVKNAVIVPVGAKGGFVVKRPPAGGGREAVLEEGIACYKGMMAGLLDVTDNLVGDATAPPGAVVRHDDDDSYLVVAADKGTASFSDIANGVAADYDFWLDDAFASGGSSGYDHKKMAITARGAWESVKRHFRELGNDTQTTDFTCVGIGDMSGDVFGNGMLLSKHIRLIGAFNHLHVFFDPDPDAARSFKERERLFKLPRSVWLDYDPKLISEGGGVFDRKAKSVEVTAAMRKLLGITRPRVTPNELIHALLKAPVDLLWNGGIGTYVKAHGESHAEVGDRTNDALRVDGRDLRCRVVGEGGNLGLTQLGRIEFALAGGRINTDAIDNSAGVDCSDHEVNIKVLLGDVVANGDLTMKQRDQLLARMTDEIAELVLVNNYRQTQALTVTEAHGGTLLELQIRMMRALERAGKLNPAIEDLPDEETLAERQNAGQGLTRPELSVLLAYAKITLYDDLLDSNLPEDAFLAADLVRYFPKPLQKRHRTQIKRHRLRREIICTAVTNSMVNRVGATFVNYFVEETGFSPSEIARAYTITRDAFDLRSLWNAIDALDNKVPAEAQTGMLVDIGRLVERCTAWFLRNRPHPLDIAETIDAFTPGIGVLAEHLEAVASKARIAAFEKTSARYVKNGVPEEIARRVARLEALASALDIVQSAERRNLAVEEVSRVYFEIGERLGLEWLRASARGFSADTPWQRQAVNAIIDDLYSQQRTLTASVLESGGTAVNGAVDAWVEENRSAIERNERLLADLGKVDTVDLAMLTVANRQIRILASG